MVSKEDLIAAIEALEKREPEPLRIFLHPAAYKGLRALGVLRIELGVRAFEALVPDFLEQGAAAFAERALLS